MRLPVRNSPPEDKLLVVLFHERGAAVCIKATSELALYKNNLEMMDGVVFVEADETCFRRDTVIQPDNSFAVMHDDITESRVVGQLPESFKERLVHAIQNSVSMSDGRRARLVEELQRKPVKK